MSAQGGGGSPFNVSDQVIVDLISRTTNFIQGLDKAGAAMNRFLGFVFSWRGAITGGLAIVAIALIKVGRQAVAMAAVLDAALREVATLIPETADEIDTLREKLVQLSTRVPEAPELLSKALYQTISAGITDTAEAFGVLEVAAQSAIAGVTTTFTSVDAITTVLNAYQLNADEARRVSDVFFATVREGKITFDQLASSIGTVATSAALTGASVEEVGAALATLTKFGISAETSATSLNRALLAVVNATDDERAAAKALGFDLSAAAIQAKGLTGFINDLATATEGNVEALAAIFPEIRAFRAVSILAGQGVGEFNRILGATNNAAGGTSEAFEDMRGSLGTLSTLVKNRFNAILRDLGANILPGVVGILEKFLDVTDDQVQKELELLDALGRVNEALVLRRELAGEDLVSRLEDLNENLEKQAERLSDITIGIGAALADPTTGEFTSFEVPIRGLTELNALMDQLRHKLARGDTDLDPLVASIKEIAGTVRVEIADRERLTKLVEEQLEKQGAVLTDAQQIERIVDSIVDSEREFARQLIRVSGVLNRQSAVLALQAINESDIVSQLRANIAAQRAVLRAMTQRKTATDEEKKKQREVVDELESQLDIVVNAFKVQQELSRADVSAFRIPDDDVRNMQTVLAQITSGKIAVEEQEAAVESLINTLVVANANLLGQIETLADLGLQRNAQQEQELSNLLATQSQLISVLGVVQALQYAFSGEPRPLNFPKETDRSIESARERLVELRREMDTLAKFGFRFFDEMPDDLREAVEAIEDVDEEIAKLTKDMETAGDKGEDLIERLEQLADRKAELETRAEEIASTLEGRIGSDAADAVTEVERLIERRKVLADLGLDETQLSDEMIDLLDKFDEAGERTEEWTEKLKLLERTQADLREQAENLQEKDAEAAEQRRQDADALQKYIDAARERLDFLDTEKKKLRDNASEQVKYADSFRILEGVTLDFLKTVRREFGPEVEETFRESIERFADLQTIVKNAEANLAAVKASRESSSADLKRAEDRLRVAQENLNKATINLALAFVKLGLPMGDALELAEALGGSLAEIEDNTEDLIKTLRQMEGLARGILGVADAFFELNDATRQALQGVIDLASGIGQIASGNLIAGIAEAAGGIAGIVAGVAGLFGESEAERRRREALEANTRALRQLQRSYEAQERITAGLTGRELGKFLQLGEGFTIGEAIADAAARGIEDSDFLSRRVQAKFIVPKRLEALGITVEELAKFADLAGISVDALLDILETGQGDFLQAADEFDKLVEAAREFDLGTLIDEFDEKMSLFEQRVRLYADAWEDPIKRLSEMQRILGEHLPDSIREALMAFDLSTAQGRADALAFLQDIFERGLTDASVFGDFDPEAFRDAVVDFADAIHDFEDSVADDGSTRAFQVSRQITEVTGNRIVGALTTISIIDQLQLAVLREILIELGGTVPENVAAISFRAPGTELDILTVEQEQLKVLQAMLAIWSGEEQSPVLPPTTEETDLAFNPHQQTYPVPTLSPSINFAPGSVTIQTEQVPSIDASRKFIEQVVPEVDRELNRRWEAERRAQGVR